jgi:hypothetical protein
MLRPPLPTSDLAPFQEVAHTLLLSMGTSKSQTKFFRG